MNKKFSDLKIGSFFSCFDQYGESCGLFMKVKGKDEREVNAVSMVSGSPSILDFQGELWTFEENTDVVQYIGKIDFEKVVSGEKND